jgi:hypothetical protein
LRRLSMYCSGVFMVPSFRYSLLVAGFWLSAARFFFHQQPATSNQ